MADAATRNGGSEPPQQGLTVLGAAFLGVGAMVGAGIFALLGYAVVKLGVRYPSKGGFVAYLVEAFGNGRLVGITASIVLVLFAIDTARNAPATFAAMLVVVALAAVWKRLRPRAAV